jgi:hypothetical protein
MENYDVRTSDNHKVGHVAGTKDGYLLVEHGLIKKSTHPIPRDMASADDSERVVRLSISKDVFEESPSFKSADNIDQRAVAEYYGLAEGAAAPATVGYGDVAPGDPSRTAEQDARRFEDESPEQERARVRETMRPEDELAQPRKGAVGIHQDRWETKE